MANKKITLEQRNKRNKIYEITSYVVSILLGLFGIILIILSIVGDYAIKNNVIKEAEANTLPIFGVNGLSWRYYGIVLVVIALVIYLITTYLTSKSKDAKISLEENKTKRTTLNLNNTNTKE